ncbi:MAG: restriction endonuclease [Candidatus Geothermarchaeales archaeon]
MSRRLAVNLSDPRAIEIIDSIPEEDLVEQIEKFIIIGHMVLSHATIATSEEAAESLFAPLTHDIEVLREQLSMIVPTISKAAKKGALGEKEIFESYTQSFMDDAFDNVSKRGKFTDILASPKGSGQQVLIEVKNYGGTVPSGEVDKFWRDMEARGAKYGIFVSTETRITKIPSDIHMDTKADMVCVFAVNSGLGYRGHLLAYRIVKQMVERELSFTEVGKDMLNRVNGTLKKIKSDIQTLDDIRDNADGLRDTSTKTLTGIVEQASLLKQRIDDRIEELFGDLGSR